MQSISYETNLNVKESDGSFYKFHDAATTIQAAWRGYKCRKELLIFTVQNLKMPGDLNRNCLNNDISKYILIPEKFNILNNMSIFTKYYLNNQFMCDVEILVHDMRFYCHSLVLWKSSNYFKKIFETKKFKACSDRKKIKYKIKLSISKKCWIAIQNYIYGYKIEICKSMLDELIEVADALEIKSLANYLRKYILKKESNQNMANKIETQILNHNNDNNLNVRPFQILCNHYKFFRCILSFYLKKRISLEQANNYLSSKYIKYEKMNEKQLRKCIFLLKTRIKIRNSPLLAKIIDIFLKI